MSISDPGADWAALLADPRALLDLYDRAPALGDCLQTYFQIDERGTSATLALETRRLPERPRPEWHRQPYNTVYLFLHCTGIRDLTVTGWGGTVHHAVTLTPAPDGGVAVTLASDDGTAAFRAARLEVARVRAGLTETE